MTPLENKLIDRLSLPLFLPGMEHKVHHVRAARTKRSPSVVEGNTMAEGLPTAQLWLSPREGFSSLPPFLSEERAFVMLISPVIPIFYSAC